MLLLACLMFGYYFFLFFVVFLFSILFVVFLCSLFRFECWKRIEYNFWRWCCVDFDVDVFAVCFDFEYSKLCSKVSYFGLNEKWWFCGVDFVVRDGFWDWSFKTIFYLCICLLSWFSFFNWIWTLLCDFFVLCVWFLGIERGKETCWFLKKLLTIFLLDNLIIDWKQFV